MHKQVKSLLENLINTEILSPLNIPPIDIPIERPKNKDLGHFATPVAFVLTKILKQPPNAIANEICQKLNKHEYFSEASQLNGYINLTLSASFLDSLCASALDGRYFIAQPQNNQRILLEYVSANPTGPLHIGHARGAVFGDSLKRVGEFLGYDIVTEYYINDAGAQITKLGRSVFMAQNNDYPQEWEEDCYRGEYIQNIAKEALGAFGAQIFTDSHDTQAIATLSAFAKDLMLVEIQQNLADLGISFDNFVSERAIFSQWQETLQILQNNDAVYENEGKIWLKSSQKGDERDRVIVREDGEPTYLAGDIVYHRDKFLRKFNSYINIWGADHHGYIARVKASLEFLGYESKKLEILLSQMVSLLKNGAPYKMSKRAGTYILVRDVVGEIGADCLRFIFLTKKPDTHLEFDIHTLSQQDSNNPIFYINYANARIHTLLGKSNLTQAQIAQSSIIEFLGQKDCTIAKDAQNLLFYALSIHQVIQSSFAQREMQKICEYLRELASLLHSFYNAHRILDNPHQTPILKILLAVSQSLSLGLSLLGIHAKTKM